MPDDYRRTFPFKLIGPIIDAEQLSAGNQLDQQDLSTICCLARNNWSLCVVKKKKKEMTSIKSDIIQIDNRFNQNFRDVILTNDC